MSKEGLVQLTVNSIHNSFGQIGRIRTVLVYVAIPRLGFPAIKPTPSIFPHSAAPCKLALYVFDPDIKMLPRHLWSIRLVHHNNRVPNIYKTSFRRRLLIRNSLSRQIWPIQNSCSRQLVVYRFLQQSQQHFKNELFHVWPVFSLQERNIFD